MTANTAIGGGHGDDSSLSSPQPMPTLLGRVVDSVGLLAQVRALVSSQALAGRLMLRSLA